MNKEEKLIVRITSEEKELIKQKAKDAGMKLSDFVRCSSLKGTKYKTTTTTISEIEEIKD
jgi:uncharacterized protein (DUF1778 family)